MALNCSRLRGPFCSSVLVTNTLPTRVTGSKNRKLVRPASSPVCPTGCKMRWRVNLLQDWPVVFSMASAANQAPAAAAP